MGTVDPHRAYLDYRDVLKYLHLVSLKLSLSHKYMSPVSPVFRTVESVKLPFKTQKICRYPICTKP